MNNTFTKKKKKARECKITKKETKKEKILGCFFFLSSSFNEMNENSPLSPLIRFLFFSFSILLEHLVNHLHQVLDIF